MGEIRRFVEDPTLKKPAEPAHDDQTGFSPAEEKWFAEFQDDSYYADPEAMAKVAESDRAHAEYKKRMKGPDVERPAAEPKKRYSQEKADVLVNDLASVAAELKKRKGRKKSRDADLDPKQPEAAEREKFSKESNEIWSPEEDRESDENTGFDQAAWFADEDEAPRVVERIIGEDGEQQLTPEDFDEMNKRL